MKIKSKIKCLIEDLKHIIFNNFIYLLIFGAVFLIGLILGFIFSNTFLCADGIIFGSKDGNLFIIKETGFFPYFINVFWLYLKILISTFVLSLFKNFRWGMFIITLTNGISFAIFIVAVFSVLGIIGFGYLLVGLILFISLVFITYITFCFSGENQPSAFISDKNDILCLTRFYLIFLITAFILSLILTLIIFFVIRTLFSLI